MPNPTKLPQRHKFITIKVSPEEREKLHAIARDAGYGSLSAFMRVLALSQARQAQPLPPAT